MVVLVGSCCVVVVKVDVGLTDGTVTGVVLEGVVVVDAAVVDVLDAGTLDVVAPASCWPGTAMATLLASSTAIRLRHLTGYLRSTYVRTGR